MNFSAEYQVTFEEYRDAVQALSKHASAANKLSRQYLVILAAFFAVAIALVIFSRFVSNNAAAPVPAPVAQPDPLHESLNTLLSLAPWVLVLTILWFVFFRHIRGRYRRFFDKSPSLHRVRTIHIADDSITFSDPTMQTRFFWTHYTRFTETAALFMLFTSDLAAEFIPKRIFPDAQTSDAFRELLARNINSAGSAFPVIPVAAPASQSA
jgi:YcxB-like protein